MSSKSDIRKACREARKAVSSDARQQAGQSAAKILNEHPLFIRSQHIACYLATKTEFETQAVIEAVWKSGKVCYIPAVKKNKRLEFVAYQKNDKLEANQYGIFEPQNKENTISVNKLDLVMMPLTAFDLQGNRLGAGAGYYDKTFSFITEKSATILLGLGYECQKVNILPQDEWDIKLNGVLTERELILF